MSIQNTSAQNGARLNYLYQQYQQQPNPDTQNALFAEILNYSERIITIFAMRKRVPTGSVLDGVQEACLKVFTSLEAFKSRSKFSTWVFTIAKNAFYGLLRQDSRQRKRSFIEGKHYGEYAGKSHPRCGDDSEEVADSVFLLSQRELSEEDRLNLQLDRQRLEQSLSDEDFEIFQSYLEGENASETAKRLRVKTKHVYNRRQVIKNRALQVRKAVPVARTISAKDAEDLAQGNRRTQRFAQAFRDLERKRWAKLTVRRAWYSDNQVFPTEDFTVFGSFGGAANSSRLSNSEGIIYFWGQGVFHPRYGYGVIDREHEKAVTVRFRSSLQTVEKSSLRSADSGADSPAKLPPEHYVSPIGIRLPENIADQVSKIPVFERLSIGEGLSPPLTYQGQSATAALFH